MAESSAQPHKNKTSYEVFESATADLRRKLIKQEHSKKSHYQLFTVGFNILAIVQLAIGATITALGPLADEHMVAITILGAVNTVVAGILALMKGRGLPQRLRNDIAEIRKVMTSIENTGIRLKYSNNECPNDEVMCLIDGALDRYITMWETIDKNQPDSYTGGNSPPNHANGESTEGTDTRNKLLAKGRPPDEEMAHEL
ncbi:hypothetical protein BJX96DRAFT_187910 [Aspergillus floccosus]